VPINHFSVLHVRRRTYDELVRNGQMCCLQGEPNGFAMTCGVANNRQRGCLMPTRSARCRPARSADGVVLFEGSRVHSSSRLSRIEHAPVPVVWLVSSPALHRALGLNDSELE